MATLYEINQQIASCIMEDGQIIDTQTGEILDYDALDALQMARDEKIENIALFIKNINAEAAALKVEKDAFAERERIAKAKADRLKEYLAFCLEGEKFKTAKVAISYRQSDQVIVDDITKVPAELLKVKEPEADKTAIKRIIKAGGDVAGCHMIDKSNIQIK